MMQRTTGSTASTLTCAWGVNLPKTVSDWSSSAMLSPPSRSECNPPGPHRTTAARRTSPVVSLSSCSQPRHETPLAHRHPPAPAVRVLRGYARRLRLFDCDSRCVLRLERAAAAVYQVVQRGHPAHLLPRITLAVGVQRARIARAVEFGAHEPV